MASIKPSYVCNSVATLLLLVLFIVLRILSTVSPPTERGFYCNDDSIRYPSSKQDTVPDWALLFISIGLPLVAVSVWQARSVYSLQNLELHACCGSFMSQHACPQSMSISMVNSIIIVPLSRTCIVITYYFFQIISGSIYTTIATPGDAPLIKLRLPRPHKSCLLKHLLPPIKQYAWYIFALTLLTTIVDFTRLYAGELRPEFFHTCDPDLSQLNCTSVDGFSLFISQYTCRGDTSRIREARYSTCT